MTADYLGDIADAIRGKLSVQTQYKPGQMAGAIESIPSGGITPTGTINITENGTVDVTQYATANVAVSGGGGDDPFALKDYLESSGTQWIDTGYTTKSNTKYDAVILPTDTVHQYPVMFGARAVSQDGANAQAALFALAWNNSYVNPMWGTAAVGYDYKSYYLNIKTKLELSAAGAKLLSNGIACRGSTLGTSSYSPTNQYSIWIFNLNDHGAEYSVATRCNMKLYRFRIYEDETLVHEFLPWLDGNNVACLKDTVTGDLKYNAGTGAFTYGTDA